MSKYAQHDLPRTYRATSTIEDRLRRISQDILPSTPYLLTVPSLYHLSAHQANDWRRGCPFEANEERLQYLTFRSHFDKDTIFHAVGDWDDGNGNIMSRTGKTSGLNSPLPGQAPKKKISLLDYRNKSAGHANTKGSPSRVDVDISHPELVTTGAHIPQPILKPLRAEKPHGVKRPVDAVPVPQDTISDNSSRRPLPTKEFEPSDDVSGSKPATIEKSAVWDLPPMLSPTLPSEIEEELAKIPSEGGLLGYKKSKSIAAPVPEKQTVPKTLSTKDTPRNTKSVSEQIHSSGRPDGNLNGSNESQSKSTLDRTANGDASSLTAAHDSKAGSTQKSSIASASSSQPSDQKRRVLKLKIPKSIRKNCIRILQMQPRPLRKTNNDVTRFSGRDEAKEILHERKQLNGTNYNSEQSGKSEQPKGQSKPPTIRTQDRTNPLEEKSGTRKSGGKRGWSGDQETTPDPPSKRQMQSASLDLLQKPHTPIKPPLRSPLIPQQSSAQKSYLSTPKRDLKSTAMHRIGSSEGEVKTPQGVPRGGTPTAMGSSDRTNRDGRSSSNTSSGGLPAPVNEDSAVWRVEQKRFEALGRTLKHEAKVILPEDGDFKNDTPSMRQGAAVAFESVLAFMLAFAISDEINRLSRQPTDSTPWRSLVPFLRYVENVTRIYRPLLGLTHQLEAVCRDTMSLYDAERLEREAPPPSVADDQRSSTVDSSATYPSPTTEKVRHDLAAKHADNLRQLQQAWQLGYSEISVREMQRSFPKTWEKSADSPGPGKGKEKLSPKSYASGPYYLPLGPTSSVIEGVRVGWQVLGEWCKKNEVKWEGKLGL